MQSGDQHTDPKQLINKLNCSHHRHILPKPGRFWRPSLSSGDVALPFTFVVLVNAPLGTRGTLGTWTLHLAVKVNLTTVNDTLRAILRCGCFGVEYTATD
jgi:hypothetical protein